MKKLALIAIAVLLAPAAASAADLSGAWKLVVMVADMTVPISCTFADASGALTGTCNRTDQAESPSALTGTLDGAKAKWAYDVKFQDMPLHIEYAGDLSSDTAMTGTISVAGQSGTFTASK